MKRTIFIIGLTLLLALAFTVPVWAGGWAVITLDELPGDVEANQPLEIGFMIRQHGVTPMSDLPSPPVIRAQLVGSTESVIVEAHEEGEVGHYAATLILPKTGEWQWSIQAFTGTQPMPALTVVEATVAVTTKTEPVKPASNTLPLLAGGVGLLGAVGGLFALQKKVRWAAAFVVVGLLVSGVGFVSAANQPKAEAKIETEVQDVSPVSSISQVELGRDLFIAKGCMMCHAHSETNNIREFGIDSGPNLTNLTASPEYLHLWLKDPKAAKSTATMPNLELTETEMDALIAFINAE